MTQKSLGAETNHQITEKFLQLVQIMDELREKCPWDQKQTIASLRSMTIEETYELADAIDQENWPEIQEELGDILLHLLFYTKIAQEKSKFTLVDVLTGIAAKMIKRHPHIYGDIQVDNEEDVKKNWQKIKLEEGKKSVFSGVPKGLPAVVKATRIQDKARQIGFEWDQKEAVFEKVTEELTELQQAIKTGQQDDIEEEFGDCMFSLVNYARFLKVDAETALEKCNRKFIKRFQKMESIAAEQGHKLADMDLAAMDSYWEKAKLALKTPIDDK